jgi:hypothetical protein
VPQRVLPFPIVAASQPVFEARPDDLAPVFVGAPAPTDVRAPIGAERPLDAV